MKILKWHYIYFFNLDKCKRAEFGKMHYYSILSTLKTNPEFQIIYHTNVQPEGEWWDLVKDKVELRIVEPETEAFGNTIYHPAHISDFYRIKLLINEGGVYTDFDTIQLKSFLPLITDDTIKMGKINAQTGATNNGVIIAPVTNSPYMIAWLDEWKNFRSKGKDQYWLEMSRDASLKLQVTHGDHLTVLDSKVFYPFIFMAGRFLYDTDNYKKLTNSYSLHLYDSQYFKRIEQNHETLEMNDSTYKKVLNNLLYKEPVKITQLF